MASAGRRAESGVFDRDGKARDKGRSLRVAHSGRGEALLDTGDRVNRLRRRRVVVTLQRLHQFSRGADNRDAPYASLQREGPVLVFEQHHGLASRLQCECAVFWRVVLGQGNPAKGITRRWIERAKLKARAEQAP